MRPHSFLIIAFLAILTSNFSPADAQKPSVRLGDVASLIVRMENRYARMRGLSADFEQIYRTPGTVERRESGRLMLERPGRMRWEYDPKRSKLFIVNGNEIWFYIPSDREAVHGRLQSGSDARVPFLFLLGHTNLRSDFRFSEGDNNDKSEVGYRTVVLTPRHKMGEIHEMKVRVAENGAVSGLELTDHAGATSEIVLTNIRENFVAPRGAFIFHPPSGVSVRQQD